MEKLFFSNVYIKNINKYKRDFFTEKQFTGQMKRIKARPRHEFKMKKIFVSKSRWKDGSNNNFKQNWNGMTTVQPFGCQQQTKVHTSWMKRSTNAKLKRRKCIHSKCGATKKRFPIKTPLHTPWKSIKCVPLEINKNYCSNSKKRILTFFWYATKISWLKKDHQPMNYLKQENDRCSKNYEAIFTKKFKKWESHTSSNVILL